MGTVAVCGSANMDVFGYVERLPRAGETLLGTRLVQAPGGKGANQAVAAARIGASVRFHGARGEDDFGAALEASLRDAGADTAAFRVVEGTPTGVALILVAEQGGENQIVVIPGANGEVTAPPADTAVDVWLAQAEIPVAAVEGTLAAARATGARAVVNPSPAERLPARLVASFDAAIVNEGELAALGEARPPLVVLTLGARGARLLPDGPELPALAARVLDTTGAGDSLAGAFAAGLAEGMAPAEALELGLAAASLCVERYGCQPAMPTRAEVDRRRAAS